MIETADVSLIGHREENQDRVAVAAADNAVLLVVIERQPLHYAAAYALVLTLLAYALFAKALKSPLEQGIFGF